MSYEEEDTCMSYEEEDTCLLEGVDRDMRRRIHACHMRRRRRIHACHMRRRTHACCKASTIISSIPALNAFSSNSLSDPSALNGCATCIVLCQKRPNTKPKET